jgi:acetyltransferase-like isoleucine patch superfamily enzyme
LDAALRSSPADASHAATSPVTIGSDVFIGGRSIILKGVQIGQGAVIGAGSIVTKDVPEWNIVAGNPARSVGSVPHPAT